MLDTFAVRGYVALLDDSGTLPPDSLPLKRAAPADYADTHTWVRYALAINEGGSWRLRHTDIDNAPLGRAIYWNSTFAHLIGAAGRVQQLIGRKPMTTAIEEATAWFNLPLFLIVVIGFSAWCASRLGAAAGVLTAFGMAGHRWFYDGFAPNYVDHHGLLTAACFGVVLGTAFMGAGWVVDDEDDLTLLPSSLQAARRDAIVAGIAGGLGLWISAASVIPTILFVAIGGAAAGWLFGPAARKKGAVFHGSLWRLWGRVGCVVALLGYLAEYAPNDFGMRMEVNHPLYALAWLAGGEMVAIIVEWRVAGLRPTPSRALWTGAAVIAPLIAIAIGGSRVFVPLDPDVSSLHTAIGEFHSLPAFIDAVGWPAVQRFVVGFVLLLPVFVVMRADTYSRIVLASLIPVVLSLVALACWQVRWWLMASGPQLCLLVLALAWLVRRQSARRRWAVVLVLTAAFGEQFLARIWNTRSNVETKTVSLADALQPLYRDAAVVLRASSPDASIVLLASPNASTAIGYFGRFKTLASLYWENVAGLKAAAKIFSSNSDEQAHAAILSRGVTHIAITSSNNFLLPYLEFAQPNATREDWAHTFGYRLLTGQDTALWLRPLPFRPRFPQQGDRAFLFQVVPDQTPFEAAWNRAVANAAAGDGPQAEQDFQKAVLLRDPDQQAFLFESAGRTAYQWQAHELALLLLQSSLAKRPSSAVEANMAWIRATSSDERARDGPAALATAERLAKLAPRDQTVLDVLAAALAENRQFNDAVAVADRMLALAQSARDAQAESRARERLASYRAGQPWRQ